MQLTGKLTNIYKNCLKFLSTHIGVSIFLLAFAMRLLNFDLEAINSDEHFWHERTYRYQNAYLNFNFPETLIAGHPGASLTFISSISTTLGKYAIKLFITGFDFQDFPYLTHTFDLVHLLFVINIMLLSSFTIFFVYYTICRVFNQKLAIISALFLIFDFFYLGHSRVVQLDSMQSSFLLLTLMSLILFCWNQSSRYLIACTLFFTLSVLTKIYSLAFLPFLLFVILFVYKRYKLKFNRSIFMILLLNFMLVLAILPAIFFSPLKSFNTFYFSIFNEGIRAEKDGTAYFAGSLYTTGEPKSFYPVSLVFRQSPIQTIFFILSIILLIKRHSRKDLFIWLIFFTGILWMIFLSIPNKLEDRYILFSHLCFDIVAAFGFYQILAKKSYLYTVILIMLGLNIYLSSGSNLKFQFLGFYNPLFGGPSNAAKYIQVGWGEGLRDVAGYLNSLENVEDITVVSWHESALSPLCECKVKPTFLYKDPEISYFVFYSDQLQTMQEMEMIKKHFLKDKIVYVSKLNGYDYAFIAKK